MCNNVCACLMFCALVFLVKCVEIGESKHPAFPNRRAQVRVRPEVHHARTKRQLSTTRQESGLHHHELFVTIALEDKPYTLDLRLNHDLLPEGHTISYQEGEKTVLHKPKKEEIDLCQYTGHIRGNSNSWVALSTCHGLRGAINDGSKIRYIEPSEGSDLHSLHYVYEQDDVKTGHRCGTDDLYPQTTSGNKDRIEQLVEETNQENTNHKTRHRRAESFPSFPIHGSPFNASERSRYVELVLVVDYSNYEGAKGDLKKLYHQLQESTNILHAIYAPLNIFIALTGVEVWSSGDRIHLSPNGTITLDNFLKYRREVLLKNIKHDHAQLITATVFSAGVIGEAYLSKMGSNERSGAIIYRPAYRLTAAQLASTAGTMAHEMGHSFGMSHDTAASGCRARSNICIMHSSAATPIPTQFSEYSLKELVVGFYQGIDYGLRNKPKSLFGSPSCGNGFVDPGEQCDCGVRVAGIQPTACQRCCDPHTCRLRANATCATGACCNLQTCQIKPVATLCRGAERECDLPEYCTGKTEHCPEDVFKMDTTPCSDKAYCVQGQCRSHDTQCQLLFGVTGKNGRRDCYDRNVNGDDISNCGYDPLTQIAKQCKQRDAYCGRLYCHHYNTNLEFGKSNSRRKIFYSPNYATGISICDAVHIDGGSSVEPGLVPDGAECGAGQMCLHQICVSVDAERSRVFRTHSEGCRANCSGHGICNSKGQCHCDDGFAPPLCDRPGVGGSDGSGPAGDPNVQETSKLVMYIIFLGLVPLIALILPLIYCMKQKSLLCFDKGNKTYQSISSTTIVKNVIHSLFKNNERNVINISNSSTDFNGNTRPEPIKTRAKYDIKIIRDHQAQAALLTNFDINSYVNCRNGTKESVMKITHEDIKVILSGTAADLPKLLPNERNKVNKNNFGASNVTKNVTVEVNVEHTPQIKAVDYVKPTRPIHAISTIRKDLNAKNVVSNASFVKQKALGTDDAKVHLKPKPINIVKPILHSKSIIHKQYSNLKPNLNRNIESKSQHMLINEVSSNCTQTHPAVPKKTIINTSPNVAIVKNKIVINAKAEPRDFQNKKPYETFANGTGFSKKDNKVVSENTIEPWPKLMPLNNLPIKKNMESSSKIVTKEKTNDLPKGSLKVKNMKNFYEDL